VDALGNLVRFLLLPGQAHDMKGVAPLIKGVSFDALLADKAFDADWLLQDLDERGAKKPEDVKWHAEAVVGKIVLLVTLDFRMSTTCLYSDVILPTATWYEKDDMNTSDMHPFIHPLSKAVDPVWESKSDWDIFKGIAKRFSELCEGHLGVEKDLVTVPVMHDTPAELAQPDGVKAWWKGECDLIPGKTAPTMVVVERG